MTTTTKTAKQLQKGDVVVIAGMRYTVATNFVQCGKRTVAFSDGSRQVVGGSSKFQVEEG